MIEIGDLVWQDTDDAKPASGLTNHGSQTANQAALADAFLGVAMQRSRSGETAPIRVATTGVFEFDCASGTFELGDLVGADENAAGNGAAEPADGESQPEPVCDRTNRQTAGRGHHQRVGRHPLHRHDRRRGRRQPQRSVKRQGLGKRD